jgi:hypothetical protein
VTPAQRDRLRADAEHTLSAILGRPVPPEAITEGVAAVLLAEPLPAVRRLVHDGHITTTPTRKGTRLVTASVVALRNLRTEGAPTP